jgi:serine/threonine-protein kinase HipA
MTYQVWVNDRPVGRLDRHGRGTTFVYDAGVDPGDAISLTMPVRTASYDQPYGLLPVFDTNLPEGALLARVRKHLAKGLGRVDGMDVLGLTGGNQIGRVRVMPEGERPVRRPPIGAVAELLEREATREMIDEVMSRYALRSGVSGAMPKVLAESDRVLEHLSRGGIRTTLQTRDYIVKFEDEDYPGLSLNEHFCMLAAEAAGNRTAEHAISRDGKVLFVRRFDEQDGERIGFDDLASLNLKTAETKYDGSVERDLFKRVGEFSGDRKRQNLEELYRICVTNCALRNGDAHLKNFALLYPDAERGPFELSPAYDIVTTTAYLEKDMMALTLNGSKRWPKPADLVMLGARAGLSRAAAERIMAQVAEGVARVLPEMRAGFAEHGQGEVGDRIARAWETGLTRSLGVVPDREVTGVNVEDPFDPLPPVAQQEPEPE